MKNTPVGTILVSTVLGLGFVTGGYTLAENHINDRAERKSKLAEEHAEKINTILGLNALPDNYLNPLTNKECNFNRVPVLDELIRKGVDEITLKTNISGISWNKERGEVEGANYRSSSYKDTEKSTFDKRHLAVSYKMKNTDTWQAFTQEQIRRIFLETSYAIFFPPKDGVCTYNSRTTEWKSVDLIGISSSPSEELTKRLNEGQAYPVPRRTVAR